MNPGVSWRRFAGGCAKLCVAPCMPDLSGRIFDYRFTVGPDALVQS